MKHITKEELLELINSDRVLAYAVKKDIRITTYPYDKVKLLFKLRLFNLDNVTMLEKTHTVAGYDIIIPTNEKTLLLKSL